MENGPPEDRVATFLESMQSDASGLLGDIEREAVRAHIPVICGEMQSLLRVLLAIVRPRRILEVGTAVGFSALFMCEHSPEDCLITTIEKDEKRLAVALENFRRAGKAERITAVCGDAAEVLKGIGGEFDFIFMDAAKGQYVTYLPYVVRLLAARGVLLSDNILRDGEILMSRYALPTRERTTHARLREYLRELTTCGLLESTLLPIGDGAAISVRTLPLDSAKVETQTDSSSQSEQKEEADCCREAVFGQSRGGGQTNHLPHRQEGM